MKSFHQLSKMTKLFYILFFFENILLLQLSGHVFWPLVFSINLYLLYRFHTRLINDSMPFLPIIGIVCFRITIFIITFPVISSSNIFLSPEFMIYEFLICFVPFIFFTSLLRYFSKNLKLTKFLQICAIILTLNYSIVYTIQAINSNLKQNLFYYGAYVKTNSNLSAQDYIVLYFYQKDFGTTFQERYEGNFHHAPYNSYLFNDIHVTSYDFNEVAIDGEYYSYGEKIPSDKANIIKSYTHKIIDKQAKPLVDLSKYIKLPDLVFEDRY